MCGQESHLECETIKLRIEADKDVQMAMAQALGQFMSRGNYNIYGDPTTMSQMFTQGFTTKAHGHGVGLHNSSLAAIEMGGALRCESAGVGQGASFILELPSVQAERQAEPAQAAQPAA